MGPRKVKQLFCTVHEQTIDRMQLEMAQRSREQQKIWKNYLKWLDLPPNKSFSFRKYVSIILVGTFSNINKHR